MASWQRTQTAEPKAGASSLTATSFPEASYLTYRGLSTRSRAAGWRRLTWRTCARIMRSRFCADCYRVWRLYLGGMAHAFDRGGLSVAQVLAYKPVANRPAPRPWIRDHQYNSSHAPLATALEWERGIRERVGINDAVLIHG
jgi:hypothetical protein